ncbi:MAG: choice-of-anchor U domain-containing protein [Desulfobacteraceae bacterium]
MFDHLMTFFKKRTACFASFFVFFIMTLVSAFGAEPVVTITSPDDGSDAFYGNRVDFVGSAVDDTDGDSIVSYSWISDLDGALSADLTFHSDNLSVGEHSITLFATDSESEIGIAVITLTIMNNNPTAEISSPNGGQSFDYGENINFTGTGTDIKDGALSGNSLSWSSDIDGVIGAGQDFGTTNLSRGSHTITLTVTDSNGGTGTAAVVIHVRNTGPEIEISAPADETDFAFGELIHFQGNVLDPEEGNLTGDALVWTSSRGDPMGTGESFAIDTLSIGSHVITLTATDSEGAIAEASINITVKDQGPDSISIDKPMDGASFYLGEFIEFAGRAFDKEDQPLEDVSLVWTSDFEKTSSNPTGTIGEGNSFSVNNLKKGEHLITLTATDSSNASVLTFIVIEVLNQLPVPRITAPLNNASFVQGEEVNFSASVTDAEDEQLTGSALVWNSDIDDVIGTGVTPSAVLSPGKHTITLMAIDSQGDSAEDSISLTVEAGQENDPLALEKDNVSVNSVSLCLDATETISITGGFLPLRASIKQYSPQIVESEITQRILTINPLETGTTTLEVRDHNEHVISLTVEVLPESGEFSTASAGPDQNVMEFETVTLDGSFSVPGNYGITSWNWQQISGSVNVVLADPSAEITTFVAPCADFVSSLTFQLTITDNKGNKSTDEITVSVGDNGIEQFPDLAATFKSADGSHNLGMNIVGQGDLVLLKGRYSEFVSEQYNRPGNMIYGLIQCRIKVPSPGDSADFIIYLPQGLAQDYSCYKYNDAKGWYGVTENIMFDAARQKAYISIVDGGPCDDDGAADGIITDPLTFGTPPMENTDPPAAEQDSGGGGGGGGCFLSTLF